MSQENSLVSRGRINIYVREMKGAISKDGGVCGFEESIEVPRRERDNLKYPQGQGKPMPDDNGINLGGFFLIFPLFSSTIESAGRCSQEQRMEEMLMGIGN